MINSSFSSKSLLFFAIAALCVHMYCSNSKGEMIREELKNNGEICEAIVLDLRAGRVPIIHYKYKLDGRWFEMEHKMLFRDVSGEMTRKRMKYIYSRQTGNGELLTTRCDYEFYNIPMDSSYYILRGCPYPP